MPAAQASQLGDDIWRLLLQLVGSGRRLHLQWVPAHCGLPGHQRANVLAKEAAKLDQTSAPPPPRTSEASPAPPLGPCAAHCERAGPTAGAAPSTWTRPRPHRYDLTVVRRRWISTNNGPATGVHRPSTFIVSPAGRPPPAPVARTPTVWPRVRRGRGHPAACSAALPASTHWTVDNIYGSPNVKRQDDVVAALAAGLHYQSQTTTPR